MDRFTNVLKNDTLKRICFAVFSQGLYALLGIIINLVLPVYMSPAEYGKWQIYFFYSAYLNFIGLGYNDGIQLRLAGKEYDKLDYGLFRTSNFLIAIYGFIITVILEIGVLIFSADYKDIYFLLFISILPTLFFNIFNAFFISTNRSIIYNLSNLIYKLAFCVGVAFFIFSDQNSSDRIVEFDIFTKTLVAVVLLIIGRKLIWGRPHDIKRAFSDIADKCRAGIIVMVTVLLSGLLPVAGRIIIEHQESIEVYGIYSFGISLLSIILTFTSTIGIIIFPIIKKYNENELKNNYKRFSSYYDILLFGMFNFYFLGTRILIKIAPDYASMLVYLPLLFAMCRVIGKLQLFVFPYYKYFGAERKFLKFNILGLAVMLLGCAIGYQIAGVFGVAFASFIIMECFYFFVERDLYIHILQIKNRFDFKSIALSCCFILIGIRSDKAFSFVFMGVYFIFLLVYFIENRRNRKETEHV